MVIDGQKVILNLIDRFDEVYEIKKNIKLEYSRKLTELFTKNATRALELFVLGDFSVSRFENIRQFFNPSGNSSKITSPFESTFDGVPCLWPAYNQVRIGKQLFDKYIPKYDRILGLPKQGQLHFVDPITTCISILY